MAYLVLKGEGFWRKRQSLVFRDVRVVRFLGLRRVLRSERYVEKKAVIVLEGGAELGKTRELLKLSGLGRIRSLVLKVFILLAEKV